ncbi:MAG: peptidyl-prolyl cis-trans isomerase [Candidatus Cloacimonetes bacterium]|nr:peptidyl-prolyl cis-trans isomerase [Candidatus Cloacimonadota bacterium]MDD2506088.1 peptidyl-prolyl cis-trans isomerase [Candidatus Cloacimonadota bacterium]MDD4559671.1 peptidyl-prolyl cis-trans isomerase [Candidatus Cloacimonadota bacterium]
MSSSLQKLLLCSLTLLLSAMLGAVEISPTAVTNSNLLDDRDILAEYDGGQILRADIMARIEKIPAVHRGRFLTTDGQLQILDIISTEDVFYRKALEMGIDKSPEVTEKLAELQRNFYLQEYYKRHVTDLVVLDEEDYQEFYNDNLQLFYQSPNITIHYIQTATEEDAIAAIAELNAGASFAQVSDKYNQNTYAKGLKGVIKHITLNGNIPGVGNDQALEDAIAESTVDSLKINGPIQTDMGWHLFRTVNRIPGRQRELSEVRTEVEQRLRPKKEREVLESLRAQLKEKYHVSIDTTLVNRIDLTELAKNDEIKDLIAVSSPHNDIRDIRVKEFLADYSKRSPQEQLYYARGGGPMALMEQNLIQELFVIDGKALGYERYFENNENYLMLRRNTILRRAFEILVLETIEVSNEEIAERYELDKEEYSMPAHRSIQVLFFEDNKTAKKAWSKFNKALKKNNEKDIEKIISKYSTKPQKSIYENQYDNGIVTGLVQDADFSKRIWDNPVGYLSPVFTTANGDIVFFRTLSETPKSYRPAVEVEPRILKAIKQEKERETQERVKEELFVQYNMRKYPERVKLTLTADELFEYADNAARNRNFKDATVFFDQIIKTYNNGVDDYKAFFMKAFLTSEEIKDTDEALKLFREFLTRYPEGELHESARFMIDSLEGNLDGFEDFENLEDE